MKVDLIHVYAPWAEERSATPCVVDAVCCCLVADAGGDAHMIPEPEKHPLQCCNHFVAAVAMCQGMHGCAHG